MYVTRFLLSGDDGGGGVIKFYSAATVVSAVHYSRQVKICEVAKPDRLGARARTAPTATCRREPPPPLTDVARSARETRARLRRRSTAAVPSRSRARSVRSRCSCRPPIPNREHHGLVRAPANRPLVSLVVPLPSACVCVSRARAPTPS